MPGQRTRPNIGHPQAHSFLAVLVGAQHHEARIGCMGQLVGQHPPVQRQVIKQVVGEVDLLLWLAVQPGLAHPRTQPHEPDTRLLGDVTMPCNGFFKIERRAGFEPAALRLCRPFPWSARAPARDQQAYRWLPHGRCPTEAADQRSRVRAATAATIDAAPASLRRPATSARVAPVSTTSSTNSTWRPATGSRAS